ncbi:hypothetical protein BLL42_00195 [Pseudomonas frederiksbergensis]|uniref:Uncharacterized protein n=1 Tax=Pseudomonas frederiksbergensis TaxID=104087 RepID=A0A1J0EEK9_9PSED|nr:hypothetical protein [Pseudomonas frederiksbergensis]APC14236.1 hypothetical protein BLL42_00195 [Pseudomonas frederiksbergensis]
MIAEVTKLHPSSSAQFVKVANQWITVEGTAFAYRGVGPKDEMPLVMLNHSPVMAGSSNITLIS